MITLTKLNDIKFVLNDELIETIYENPDTTIHLQNGIYYIVKESMDEIIEMIVSFRRKYSLVDELKAGGQHSEPRVDEVE